MGYFKWAVKYCWCFLILLFILFNVGLYFPTPLAHSRDALPPRILPQLAGVKDNLEQGSAADMQSLFPEGHVFSYLFYGLAWVEVGLRDSDYLNQSLTEAKWALEFVDAPESFAPFPDDLPPDHGMFYASWRAHLLAGIVLLEQGQDAQRRDRLRSECDQIANTLETSSTPFPASYHNSSWPCDTVPGIHAMAVHDHVTGEAHFSEAIENWKTRARVGLDPATGLIAHLTDPRNGSVVLPARATSQTVILRLLPDIDPDLADEHYHKFREHFFTTFIGLPSVLEYSAHSDGGGGDVDSGPLIFGRSLSATCMTIGLAQIYGDDRWAEGIAVTGEVVGMPYGWTESRKYAFGLVPIGDAIVAYAYTARPWIHEDMVARTKHPLTAFWRWPMHGVLLVLIFGTVVVRRFFRTRKQESQ